MSIKNKSRYFKSLESCYGKLTFGDTLRAWRESEGLTQTDFATKLKLSVQNLNDLEKGRKIPTALRVSQIAKKLCLPEIPLIQIAIRDALAKDGFQYNVRLEAA
jgi:transcriptional regulator with XRE-family HTH domain